MVISEKRNDMTERIYTLWMGDIQMEELDPEFSKTVDDNFWDLSALEDDVETEAIDEADSQA